jgi:nitroreductase
MILPAAAITTTIRRRYSCRSYNEQPISTGEQEQLGNCLAALHGGPLGTPLRYQLAAASEQERDGLRGLGTYGQIKGAPGFIIGAAGPGEMNLEDYGYGMEQAVLCATALGLDTCWLGGGFTQSSFARKIGRQPAEIIPAVAAVGHAAEAARQRDRSRLRVQADQRLPWDRLFFREAFDNPLTVEQAGDYGMALEMVRLAPSAKNKQPWRLVQAGNDFHFYLQRTPGYGPGTLTFKLLHVADLQRMDMGIAMCHFELATQEAGLAGRWVRADPGLEVPDELTRYVVTWRG